MQSSKYTLDREKRKVAGGWGAWRKEEGKRRGAQRGRVGRKEREKGKQTDELHTWQW